MPATDQQTITGGVILHRGFTGTFQGMHPGQHITGTNGVPQSDSKFQQATMFADPVILTAGNLQRLRGHHLRITGQDQLLGEDPALARSLERRRPYLDPLNALQTLLIERCRERPDEVVWKEALLRSINGIAAGMRNTG